ncbi:LuxR C-terminal-related transcriptional regulator [Kitasatospora sp. NPDC051853]|uniref:helix-turn-helix transcriptional regulator n=1 Tax=Kitasatospora sp. NPDC051853 TaxID=3364058 RepID=UPI0037B38E66
MRSAANEVQERDVVEGILESARTVGAALAVTGEPGCGVSTVLGRAAAAARRRGFLVVETAALAADADVPGAVVRALRDRLFRALRPAFSPALFGAAAAQPVTAAELFRLIAGSPRPVLVCVDDARFLDERSRRCLADLARELPGAAAVLLLGGPAPDGVAELVLRPLDDDRADALLREAGVADDALRRRIVRDAGGNPLALRELPAAWRAAGAPAEEPLRRLPPLTERLVRSAAPGLDGLPPDTACAVLLAAVQLGDHLAGVLTAVRALTGRAVGPDVLDPAVALGLLRPADGRVRFRSGLARAAVQQHAGTPALLAAHAALARSAGDPYLSAWHSAQGAVHPDEEVAGPLEASEAEARRRREPVEALRRLELAARLSPTPADGARRLVRAARTAFELDRPGLAEHLLLRAERLGPDLEQRILADNLRTRFTARPERAARSLSEHCRLVSRLVRAGRREAALDVLAGATEAAAWADRDPRAQEAVTACLAGLADLRDDPRWLFAQAAVAPGEARERIAGAVAGAPAATAGSGAPAAPADPGDPAVPADAEDLRLLGTAALTAGEPGWAGDLLARSARLLRADGRTGLLAQVQAQHAQAAVVVGDWDLAHTVNEEAFALAEASGQQLWSIRARATRAVLLAFRGDLAGSAADIAAVERIAAGRQVGAVLATLRLARSVALFDSDDPGGAYQTLRPVFEPGSPSHHLTSQRRTLCYLAEAAVRSGDAEDARRLLAGYGDGDGLPLSTAVNLAQARALLAEGPDAEGLFEHALRITPRQWPWPRARVELAYGMWLRRDRRPRQARPLLREACHTFEVLEAAAWREISGRELRATGVDRGPQGGGLTELLSAQELTIAQLAASGMTNREIGERLLLSPRTVGWHLHRVFPKLNVTSRTHLAALLAAAA